VHTELVCGPENEGGPEVAHGGWTAGAFDELLGQVPLLHGQLAVTGQLTVTYVKPVPVGRPLHARAWLERQEGHRWYVVGEMVLASTGAVLARGSGDGGARLRPLRPPRGVARPARRHRQPQSRRHKSKSI
jgi:acyl-coenzyme A thioesterase PaaI-like protein